MKKYIFLITALLLSAANTYSGWVGLGNGDPWHPPGMWFYELGDMGNIIILWDSDDNPHLITKFDVYRYTKWDGQSWSEPLTIDILSDKSVILPKAMMDSENRIHFLYKATGENNTTEIYYIIQDGSGWKGFNGEAEPTLVASFEGNIGANWFDFCLDHDNNPHIVNSHVDIEDKGQNDAVYYSFFDGDQWSSYAGSNEGKGILPNDTVYGFYPGVPKLALDSEDIPHILFPLREAPDNESAKSLYYWTWDGESWKSTADNLPMLPGNPVSSDILMMSCYNIAVDSHDVPWVSYPIETDIGRQIMIARLVADNWVGIDSQIDYSLLHLLLGLAPYYTV